MDSLVTTDWLAAEQGKDDLRILDATYFMSGSGRDGRAEHEAAHIPGAVFFDLADISDGDSPLPNMLPPPHKFASRMQSLGIGDGARIVVYDNSPLHSAARAWWMLRTFGAPQVSILDGGLTKWQAEGRPVETGGSQVRHGHFTPLSEAGAVADKAFMLGNLTGQSHQILDARSQARFAGSGADPHGVAGGHIPGSANLPQDRLFNDDGTYKQDAALKAEYDAARVDLARPLVATCGSGVTACVLLFGAHLLGHEGAKLYDGSWSEWGADPATPKAMFAT